MRRAAAKSPGRAQFGLRHTLPLLLLLLTGWATNCLAAEEAVPIAPVRVMRVLRALPIPLEAPVAQAVPVRVQAVAAKAEAAPAKAEAVPVQAEAKAEVKVEAKEARVEAAPAPADAAEGENSVQAIAQQLLPQLRQLMRVELGYAESVCEPTKDQSQRLKRASESTLQQSAKTFAAIQKKMMQGQWRGDMEYPDARETIRKGLLQAMKAILTPKQLTQYQVESDKRRAAHNQAAIQSLVVRMDDDLVLTAQQREKLIESLLRGWKDAWGRTLEMYASNQNPLPKIPDELVLPILNETQKKIWRAAPKNDYVTYGDFGLGGMFVVEEAVEAEPLAVPDADPAQPADKLVLPPSLAPFVPEADPAQPLDKALELKPRAATQ